MRDFTDRQPSFAVGAELLAIHWLVQGTVTRSRGADVWAAYSSTVKAAEKNGNALQSASVKKAHANETPEASSRESSARSWDYDVAEAA